MRMAAASRKMPPSSLKPCALSLRISLLAFWFLST
jgi:hypothetical protein